jgi:RHO1 GDP-GTP exchange protein 1/2
MRADPPVIAKDRVQQFVYEVFWNFDAILARHQRLVTALFERQRDQHPIIQNIGDIILEATLAFREDYESYIKVSRPCFILFA